jgi:L-histidine N-alpha-methyltransferase
MGVLEAAYNDSEGVTAEFNLNVLRVLNRELGADFDVEAFEHVAFFDRDNSWVEMRLRARGDQRVSIPGAGIEVELADGEEIRTEISSKFTLQALHRELAAADMAIERFFTDPEGLFGLSLAAPR